MSMKNSKEGGLRYLRGREHDMNFDTSQYPNLKYLYTALAAIVGVTYLVANKFLSHKRSLYSRSQFPSDVNKLPLIDSSFPSVTGNRRHSPRPVRHSPSHR